MNLSGDASAGAGAVNRSALAPSGGWHSGGGQLAFWLIASIGTIVLCVAWFWYGLSFFEEMTEQGKAVAASSSMAGFGLLVGGIPLVIAHVLVLVRLLVIGAKYHSRRAVGIVFALLAVSVASALGIAVNELLWTGDLFAMSAAHIQRL